MPSQVSRAGVDQALGGTVSGAGVRLSQVKVELCLGKLSETPRMRTEGRQDPARPLGLSPLDEVELG